MTDLPDPEEYAKGFLPRLEQVLTPEAREWLDRVLDLRDEASAADRPGPSAYSIADKLSAHLKSKITRGDVESYCARRRDRAT